MMGYSWHRAYGPGVVFIAVIQVPMRQAYQPALSVVVQSDY